MSVYERRLMEYKALPRQRLVEAACQDIRGALGSVSMIANQLYVALDEEEIPDREALRGSLELLMSNWETAFQSVNAFQEAMNVAPDSSELKD